MIEWIADTKFGRSILSTILTKVISKKLNEEVVVNLSQFDVDISSETSPFIDDDVNINFAGNIILTKKGDKKILNSIYGCPKSKKNECNFVTNNLMHNGAGEIINDPLD